MPLGYLLRGYDEQVSYTANRDIRIKEQLPGCPLALTLSVAWDVLLTVTCKPWNL